MKWYKWLDLYYLESVRNDATVFPDISKENISAKIPTRCFSGTLPHSLTRTCSLFWGWLPFSGNKGRIWEFVPQKHWLTFEGVLLFYLIRGRKMHPFLFDQVYQESIYNLFFLFWTTLKPNVGTWLDRQTCFSK